jgi:hypothetical protein
MEENDNNKEEYIKIFEKKLKEVEIYIQKNLKPTDEKYLKFKDFKMNDFINVNTELVHKRDTMFKEINLIKGDLMKLKNENEEYYQETHEMSFSKKEEDKNTKVKEFMSFYKNQIKVIEMRIKLLRTYFKDMKLIKFNLQKRNFLFKIRSRIFKTGRHC